MEINTFRELFTHTGEQALRSAAELTPREEDFLSHFQKLSRRYPRELARSALEVAILREEARSKFPMAEQMYFTRQSLEQATSYEVSRYRAGRYRSFQCVADLGCSIGGDSLALAEIVPTLGVDRDMLRLCMAQVNLRASQPAFPVEFLLSDLTCPLPFSSNRHMALFFDPARRDEGGRVYSVEHYSPPLSTMVEWLPQFSALGVKISPGVNLEEIQGYQAEVEFISSNGDLKEATLWFGPLKSTSRRATVLPGPHTMTPTVSAWPTRRPDVPRILPGGEPQSYLYEPDAAVIRAGLVEDLGVLLNAIQLDPDIAYLSTQKMTPTPFARVWEIEDWFPFQLKRLRAYLRERGVGRVVVKKRGSPLQPESLIRKLRLDGVGERILFLTHLEGNPIVILCLPNTPVKNSIPPSGFNS